MLFRSVGLDFLGNVLGHSCDVAKHVRFIKFVVCKCFGEERERQRGIAIGVFRVEGCEIR